MKTLRLVVQLVDEEGLAESQGVIAELGLDALALLSSEQVTMSPLAQLSLPLGAPKRKRGRPKKAAVTAEDTATPLSVVAPAEAAPAEQAPSVPPSVAASPPVPSSVTLRDANDMVSALARLKGVPIAAELVKRFNVGTEAAPKFVARTADIPDGMLAAFVQRVREAM